MFFAKKTFDLTPYKFENCPSCGEFKCIWIGFAPGDIECINKDCKYYIDFLLHEKVTIYKNTDLEDKIEITPLNQIRESTREQFFKNKNTSNVAKFVRYYTELIIENDELKDVNEYMELVDEYGNRLDRENRESWTLYGYK